MLVAILVIKARISLSDAKVHNPHRLVPQSCGVGKTAIESKLRTDHDPVIVKLDSAAFVAHQ